MNALNYILAICLVLSIGLNIKQSFDKPHDFIPPVQTVNQYVLKTDTTRIHDTKAVEIIVHDTINHTVQIHAEYTLNEPYSTNLSVYTPKDSLIGLYPVSGRISTTFSPSPFNEFKNTEITINPIHAWLPVETKTVEVEKPTIPKFTLLGSFWKSVSVGGLVNYSHYSLGYQYVDRIDNILIGYTF